MANPELEARMKAKGWKQIGPGAWMPGYESKAEIEARQPVPRERIETLILRYVEDTDLARRMIDDLRR